METPKICLDCAHYRRRSITEEGASFRQNTCSRPEVVESMRRVDLVSGAVTYDGTTQGENKKPFIQCAVARTPATPCGAGGNLYDQYVPGPPVQRRFLWWTWMASAPDPRK